jgi:hypothetical protein
MTRRSRIAAAALLLLAALTTPLVGQTRQSSQHSYPIPKTLTMIHGKLPIWADASVVLTENGEPNPAIWGNQTARIREILEAPADNPVYLNGKIVGYSGTPYPSEPGCRQVGPTHVDYPDPPPRGSLTDAVTHSEVALLGRVTDKAYGFYGDAPGQLLQIEPVRWYGYPLPQARYYFFVPIGKFRIAGVRICTTDQNYAEPPDVGGEVFLFVDRPVDPAGVLLHVMDAGDIVPVNSDGSLRLPPQYAADAQDATRHAANPRMKTDLLALMKSLRVEGEQK